MSGQAVDNNLHSPLKEFMVQYVGAKLLSDSEEDSVTVEMIIEVLANEFPEIVLCLAEDYVSKTLEIEESVKEALDEENE